MRTILVAPAGHRVGLTSACLGLVRALDLRGVRVAFVKPIGAAQTGPDRACALVRLGSSLNPPEPIPRAEVSDLLARGDEQVLLERVVELAARAAAQIDVLIVEGMVPESTLVYATRVNALMLKALDAELVLVGTPRDQTPEQVADAIAIAARGLGALGERTVGAIVNRIAATADAVAQRAAEVPCQSENQGNCRRTAAADSGALLCQGCVEGGLDAAEAERFAAALRAEKLTPVALVPYQHDMLAPRVSDLATALGAQVLRAGAMQQRRIRQVVLCAMTVPNALRSFKPGTLVVTPGDRSDVIMAAALAVLGGMPLAGLLLTGGIDPEPRILELCDLALATGLPVLTVPQGSFAAAAAINALEFAVPADDRDRVEAAMAHVAGHIDDAWLKAQAADQRETRLSPPAFRHRLIERARALNKRILLPEGDEPRTVQAAAIAQSRGIARCVLLGDPERIRTVARQQGVTLPDGIEIVDAAAAVERYVGPLVERRKSKGMTDEMARNRLGDTIWLGTMMMALGEADGLVSGAVHTTAHTITPAFQVIKTAPGCDLVSSIFFMCLPDQVLVFGDCAVNPDPTAEQLADIAIQSAISAQAFGIPPRVAMLSYSTGESGTGADVDKVKQATAIAKAKRPDLLIDGPLQYDAAIMPDVARSKAPKSPVAGRATVFIFPDLNTGNVTYKAVQRSAGVISVGPMLQGLAKPVNDLSRGCLVEDIVYTIALTAIQAG